MTDEWPLIVFQETGAYPSAQERLIDIFVELSKDGIKKVVPNDQQAKEHRKSMKCENKEYITTPYTKDAAFYVDILPTGEVLLPNRVDKFANSEILGLEWYLDQSHSLREILADGKKWEQFHAAVHSRVT